METNKLSIVQLALRSKSESLKKYKPKKASSMFKRNSIKEEKRNSNKSKFFNSLNSFSINSNREDIRSKTNKHSSENFIQVIATTGSTKHISSCNFNDDDFDDSETITIDFNNEEDSNNYNTYHNYFKAFQRNILSSIEIPNRPISAPAIQFKSSSGSDGQQTKLSKKSSVNVKNRFNTSKSLKKPSKSAPTKNDIILKFDCDNQPDLSDLTDLSAKSNKSNKSLRVNNLLRPKPNRSMPNLRSLSNCSADVKELDSEECIFKSIDVNYYIRRDSFYSGKSESTQKSERNEKSEKTDSSENIESIQNIEISNNIEEK